ncbi:hypothetical protein UFOVP1004_37 [uncultured Caudovirales phage]|uniref:Uncharacterized protein n=1 Tax=uncultured Caudovirales phage TaxID=2100421 RepID=A0A6J5Q0R5_9CAUD|nr:hypothetical protein UFOVP1004_37 [uncultured Caudovirales phage]
MPAITQARQAVWDAIDNWPALQGAFRRKVRFEPSQSGQQFMSPAVDTPALGDFPSISISPSAIVPAWIGNQVQFHPLSLTVQILTAGWDSVPKSEELWTEVINAVYHAAPAGGDTYIGTATGRGPYGFGNSRWTRTQFPNGQKAWSHSFDLVLKIVTSLVV